MSAAQGHVLKELLLNGAVLLEVVALAPQTQGVALGAGALDVANLDWQVEIVAASLERSELGVDVLSLIALQGAFRVLDRENLEIVVAPV